MKALEDVARETLPSEYSYALDGRTAPVLQGHALADQVDAARAGKDAALVNYEKAFLTAIRDVADALATLTQYREERTREEEQVASLRKAVDIAPSQFQGGTATYLDVVGAQENSFAAELTLAQLEGQQLGDFTQLDRAIGGGWWLAEKRPPPICAFTIVRNVHCTRPADKDAGSNRRRLSRSVNLRSAGQGEVAPIRRTG